MHQSTAMLKLLAWLEHKAAWLALLCIARNFKTKGLQKVALEEAELLATRQGWHVNELWDRMIDSAGLDEQSRFELAHTPHGPWTAQLISSLNWTLRTPAGEPAEVSTLALSFDLDSTQRDAALKRWDETKRSVAAVIRQQKQRLDEAFYTMREWRVGIWRETFFNHPIARFLVQGVVWTVRTSAETAHAVWPADNGVFLDEKGTQLHFEDSDRISISYANDGSDFSANYWCRNFASRKQKPLLRQFGLVTVKNVALEDSRCLIYNAKGSTVCAQSLERAAKKMNYSHRYTRGLGWGPTLIKEWPAAKLLAAIELEGIWYGVQGQEIRLGHLFFLPMGRLPHWRTPLISIDNVPTPLLARCVLDFQQFAALQRSETPS